MPMQKMHGKSCRLARSVSLQQVRITLNLAGTSLMVLKPVASLLPCVLLFSFMCSEWGASAVVQFVCP